MPGDTSAADAETVLGIDIGTSATKGVLVHPDGAIVAEARRPHGLSLPCPGHAEHDAETVWWADVVAICRELVPRANSGLRAVCVSGIGPCVVPCDAALRPLRPAILYGIDTRAGAEIAELEARLGADRLLARAGSALSSQALGPKLLWLRRNEPEVWERTAGWYMASSFAAARLTGAYALDRHSASQVDPLYDMTSGMWADDWADEIAPGVPLPELCWPADPVGTVTEAAAAETSLPVGLPVVAGTVDAWAEALSVGVRRPGELMLMYGSTVFLVGVVDTPGPRPSLWWTEGVEPGRRTLAAGMSTAGSLVEWMRDLVGGQLDRETSLAEAATSPAGARGLLLLPYFAGERTPIYDPDARGVIAGLTLRHCRGDLIRATYEGIAYGIRQLVELFARYGDPVERVVAVGGGAQSALWLQIASDVTGLEQEIPEVTVGASYGSALLAAVGAGLVPPGTNWARPGATVRPEPAAKALYDELFPEYEALYGATAEIVHRLGVAAAGT